MSTVDIDFYYIDADKETRNAYFIVFEEGFDGMSCFVPKSRVEIDERRKIVTMPFWMAREKGLDYYLRDGQDEGDSWGIY